MKEYSQEYSPLSDKRENKPEYRFRNEQELASFYSKNLSQKDISDTIKDTKSEHFGIRLGQEKIAGLQMLKKIEERLLKKIKKKDYKMEYEKNEEYGKKERRTDLYIFTSINQIKDFYSEFIPTEKLEGLVAGIDAKPFNDRKEGKPAYKLQRIKRIEWELNRYLKDHEVENDEVER